MHGSVVIMAMLCWAGDVEAGEAAMAPFRALAEPIADMVRPMRLPGDVSRRRTPTTTRSPWPDDVRRRGGRRRRPRRSSSGSRRRTRRCGSRSCGCSAARWPGCRPTPRPSRTGRSRIMVNVAAFYDGPRTTAKRAGWVERLARRLRHGDDRRLRQLPGRRGRGAGPCGLPRRDLGPAGGGQGDLRPGEPLPAQPERAASTMSSAARRTPCSARTSAPTVAARSRRAPSESSRCTAPRSSSPVTR